MENLEKGIFDFLLLYQMMMLRKQSNAFNRGTLAKFTDPLLLTLPSEEHTLA